MDIGFLLLPTAFFNFQWQQVPVSLVVYLLTNKMSNIDDAIDLCSASDNTEDDSDSDDSSVIVVQKVAALNQQQRTTTKAESVDSVVNNVTPTLVDKKKQLDFATTRKKHEAWLRKVNLQYYKSHCWSCQVPLCDPNERNLDVSCYAMHSHPRLLVPHCSFCSDQVANIELKNETGEEEEVCSLCASSDTELFVICDSCEQQVCSDCVERAASSNPDVLNEITNDETKEWHCSCCRPTELVVSLQSYVEQLSSQNHSHDVELNTLLDELNMVEEKKLECEKALDSPESLQNIEREVAASLPNGWRQEAKDEYECWKYEQEKHYHRLVDMITKLQEEIERHGYNLKEYYALPKGSNSGGEPKWKQKADQEIDKRKTQEEKEKRKEEKEKRRSSSSSQRNISSARSGADNDDINLLLSHDVEDLGSLSDDGSVDSNDSFAEEQRAQWRNSYHMASKDDVDHARQMEDELVSSYQKEIKQLRRTSESQDAQATREEDRTCARVRRDSSMVVHQCQQRAKRKKREPITTITPKKSYNIPAKAIRRLSNNNKKTSRLKDDSNNSSEDETIPPLVGLQDLFQNSDFVLSSDPNQNTVNIAEPLAKLLKPHQKEGIRFMFQKAFDDLAFPREKVTKEVQENISGCILGEGCLFAIIIISCLNLFASEEMPHTLKNLHA